MEGEAMIIGFIEEEFELTIDINSLYKDDKLRIIEPIGWRIDLSLLR